MRQVFTRARASSPCVIFFDELDALVPRRDSSPVSAISSEGGAQLDGKKLTKDRCID